LVDCYELSPTQAGMLVHSLRHPNSGIDIEQVIITLVKSIDPDGISAAWRKAIERHPIMRTSFRWEGVPQPVQDVWDCAELPIEILDWREVPTDEHKSRLSTFLSADRKRGFELSSPPVMRLTLVRTAEGILTVVWTFHHILLDARSISAVLREVFDIYEAWRCGGTVSLPLPKKSYRAHIEWLRSVDLASAESYWRNALEEFYEPTTLWVERPDNLERTEQPDFGAFEIELLPEQTEALKMAASSFGVTVNSVLQGAWAIVLSRLSGARDVIFGATRACRRSGVKEGHEIVGLFINTLPVRVDVDPEAELGVWLGSIREQSLAVRRFEHTPLVKVQSWSEVARTNPLFESILVYNNLTLDEELRAIGGEWQGRRVQLIGQTNYPVALIVYGGVRLLLRLEYSRCRFDDNMARRLIGYVETLLLQIAASAKSRRIASLSLLPVSEKSELINLGRVATSRPTSVPLHTRFEEMADRHRDRIAVVCEAQTLTFAELNARANRVAHRLRELGARPDDLVGLCTGRGLNMIVGMLAILKSGAAYLPLDSAYPQERIAFMLKDAQVRIAVTEQNLTGQLSRAGGNCLVLIDMPIEAPEHNPEPAAGPNNLAYAIYTSGSTGKPKGVLITHANITRLFESTNAWFGFGSEDVWTLFHSYAFDFSVWEVWGALLYGGRLVIVPYWVSRDPTAFRKLLLEQRVSVLNQTPSAFRQLLQADLVEIPGDYALRYIIFGGETLELHNLRPWVERYGDQRPQLINMYGITETTVHVTYRPILLNDVERRQGSVIGVPIPDLYIRLLDDQGEPVPVGVPGEIYIGGAGVARGYLNRPDLTAARFITDPFDPSGMARIYRSGDLARRLPNGDIEFLGRIDQQVKIRGFRIELGEIEAAIASSYGIADVAVIAREETSGEKFLVAYVVATGCPTDFVDELRKALTAQLPDYMVPSHFILLDALPLNENGKLDRNALPAPRGDQIPRSTTARPVVPPRTDVERIIAEVWAEVLRLNQIGVADNFFELGGDSILMIQVVARCRRAGLALTARDFFKYPTIAKLAGLVSTVSAVESATEGPVFGAIQLTPIQHWFFEQDFEQPHHWNQAFLFHVPPDVDLAILEQSLGIVVTHHDALRLRFRKTEAGWTQELAAMPAPITIARYDVSNESLEHRTALIKARASDHQASLNLNNALLGAAYFSFGLREQGRLLLVVHHLAIDGVSWRILIEDTEAAYMSLAAGQTPSLPAKTTSYKAWAARLTDYAQNPAIKAALDAWALTASPATLLPIQNTDSDNRECHADTLTTCLTPTETEALLQRVPSAYRTQINDVLLTALAQTLQECTGGETFLIELEGHGREEIANDIDLSRTIGWFTTMFPVRLQLQKALDATTALKSIKEQLRKVPDRGLSYGLLRYLGDNRAKLNALKLAQRPQVLFNYLGQLDQIVSTSKLFRFASEPTGPWHSPRARRTHELEIVCLILDGKLESRWTSSAKQLSRATVEQLAHGFIKSLRRIIALCLSPLARGRTPSDYPLANLTQLALDRLWNRYPGFEDVCQLTPMQRLFFIMDTSRSEIGLEQWSFRIEGSIVQEHLRKAFEAVIARHSILRTAFVASDTDAVQVVLPEVALPWTAKDWRTLSNLQQEKHLSDLLNADAAIGFDLSRPPLMRVTLAQLRDDLFYLVWSTHHLCVDGWSWPIVFREVGAIYNSLDTGTPNELRPAPPYSQYVTWLSREARNSEDFWTEALSGLNAPTLVGFGTGSNTPRGKSGAASELTMRLGSEETSSLQAMARASQIALSIIVQGAWALLLAHYNGSNEAVFGAAFSGRPAELPDIETMVGPCVTNVPVRVRVESNHNLGTWFRTLQRQQFDLIEHQYTPLEIIQSLTKIPLHYRLFDTLLVFQNYQVNEGALRLGRNARLIPISSPENTNYALTLAVLPAEELRFRLIYDPARLSHHFVQTCAQNLKMVLEMMAKRHESIVADVLEVLPAATRAKAAALALVAPNSEPSKTVLTVPNNEIERSIAAIWQEVLGLEFISLDDNFFDMGGHSLLLLHVHARIKSVLCADLPIVALLQYTTVRTLAHYLGGHSIVTNDPSAIIERAKRQREALARRRPLAR
jgi:amino acid adenylation domain-containing protein/non-ribosomal peptide synthase protein (TIGR01720 family)